ncbi:putative sodium-dependent multivitamin transporter [Pseudolycoriella hygida]|uniref:Sodium-dependent multivitamin transporter n=1 Tax=Pseudolycoriella hygida TaxID=35572 RepID=A0A9Q0MQ16_9DIPT|nr:putative sodium-dependent multivitamin transporter [Pseudolycoriella hygida]
MANFAVWDYVVFILMLLISASIGVYFRFTGGKQKTTAEYFLADRGVSIWPVSFSLMASFMSAITLLGVSMENYQYGTLFVVINISYGLATPIAAYLYLPVFFKLQATSAYEYLEKRFGKATRLCASIAYSLQMILYMGIVLYAPALALEAVTNIDKTTAILVVGFVCTFYSTIGGMKAVLITDVFQSLLMFAAIFSVIFCAVARAGGFAPIWQTAYDGGRLEFLNFDPDPTTRHTWFSLIIGGGFTYLTLYAVNQTQVQRLLTVKDLKASQRAMWLNWPILSCMSLTTSFSGLAIYYLYHSCDPYLQGRVSSRDQLMPLFVVDVMGAYPGLSGLFVSGLFSASLSTVSAAVNSLAAVTLEDYIKPLYKFIRKRPLPETKSTLPSKITAMLFGIICIGVAFGAQLLGGVLQASLTVFGVVGGPLFALFTLGMFTTRAKQRGAITGLICGIGLALYLGFGQPKPTPPTKSFTLEDCTEFEDIRTNYTTLVQMSRSIPPDDDTEYVWLLKLSYLWYGVVGWIVTFVVGYAISVLLDLCNVGGPSKIYLDTKRQYIDTELFSPPISKLLKNQNARFLERDNHAATVNDVSSS